MIIEPEFVEEECLLLIQNYYDIGDSVYEDTQETFNDAQQDEMPTRRSFSDIYNRLKPYMIESFFRQWVGKYDWAPNRQIQNGTRKRANYIVFQKKKQMVDIQTNRPVQIEKFRRKNNHQNPSSEKPRYLHTRHDSHRWDLTP